MEVRTVNNCEKIWVIVEALAEKLTMPELFSRGKFVVLRFCNSLLRKLSKASKTEFCGRILMFLSVVFPLTERSAVNLSGKVNIANSTHYESDEKVQISRY